MAASRAAYNREWRRTHPEWVKKHNASGYARHAEKRRAYSRDYAKKHPEERRIYGKKWRTENSVHRKEYQSKWYEKNREDQLRQHREKTRALKAKILKVYGETCSCCGESNWECLTIDHLNGGGTKHREDIKGYGTNFYRWLVRNNFPAGFQTLCFNCNCSRGLYGYCPHQRNK